VADRSRHAATGTHVPYGITQCCLPVATRQRGHYSRAAASTRVVNYSSNFLLLEYSLISISGCKFSFPVAVFLQPIDNFTPSVQHVAPAGRKTSKSASELLKCRRFALRAMLPVTILTLAYQSTTPLFVIGSLN